VGNALANKKPPFRLSKRGNQRPMNGIEKKRRFHKRKQRQLQKGKARLPGASKKLSLTKNRKHSIERIKRTEKKGAIKKTSYDDEKNDFGP